MEPQTELPLLTDEQLWKFIDKRFPHWPRESLTKQKLFAAIKELDNYYQGKLSDCESDKFYLKRDYEIATGTYKGGPFA